MFSSLVSASRDLRSWCQGLDPGGLDAAEARTAITEIASMEKVLAGARLRLIRCLEADKATASWLAQQTGRSARAAQRDLETARELGGLSATDRALRDGDLSAEQAREVVSGASADPSCEQELLDTARQASFT